MTDRTEPTFRNQIWHARRVLKEQGADALYNPHAATGKICGCKQCFCCAALHVHNHQEHYQGVK